MGGRRAASLIHKQGSMLALVVRTATHFIWFSIDYGICTNVYTHLVLCIHIHTQQWGSLKESSSKCHQQFITWTFRRRRLLFWKSLICIFTFGYQTCTFADLFEGYFCNKNVLYHQTGDHSELIFPQMKGAGFFLKIHIQLEMATLNEAIQRWKERRSRQVYVLLSVVRHFQSIRGTSQIACHLFESRHFAHSHFCCLTNPWDSKKKLQYIQKANKFNPNMMKNAM